MRTRETRDDQRGSNRFDPAIRLSLYSKSPLALAGQGRLDTSGGRREPVSGSARLGARATPTIPFGGNGNPFV